ncbi:hypothetical protein V6N13_082979 [Hibiscus sabdariffa]
MASYASASHERPSMYFQLSAFPVGQLNWSFQNLKVQEPDLSCRRYRNLFAIDFSCRNKVRFIVHVASNSSCPFSGCSMSPLIGTKNNIFYIKPFDVSTWWYLGLLAMVCTVESVISDGVR